MSRPVVLLTLAALPLWTGCLTVKAATFADYLPCCSFAWRSTALRSRREQVFTRSPAGDLVRDRVAGALQSRGIPEERNGPALLVDLRVRIEEHIDANEVGYPRIYGSSPGPVVYDAYTTGTVELELTDPRTTQLLWRGTVTGLIDSHRRVDMYKLIKGVDRMLSQLPAADCFRRPP
jgi:hypothetical protein